MSSVVLDASAVLAVIQKERGHEAVIPLLKGATMSAVNYSEVLKKLIEKGGLVGATTAFLENLLFTIVPFDDAQAVAAAKIWPESKAHGLSFADRACLTLGMAQSAVVFTSDQRLAETQLDVKVNLIRKPIIEDGSSPGQATRRSTPT